MAEFESTLPDQTPSAAPPALDVAAPEPLEMLLEALHLAGLPAGLREISAELPVRQLLIGPGAYLAGPQQYDTERLMYISVLAFNEFQRVRGGATNPYSDALQFMLQLPFTVPADKQAAVWQALSVFNPLLPYGGLTLDAEGRPYFRYSWKFRRREDVAPEVLLEIINASLFFVERLGWRLEAIASGAMPLADVLAAKIDFSP